MNVPLLYFEGTGKAPARMGLAHPSICPYGAFATKDGALVLISIQNEREWVTFCAGFLDAPDLPKQPGFESNNVRVANRTMVDERVGQAFALLTRDQAAAKLRASNTAYGFVNDLAALSHHPALRRTKVALPGGSAAEIVAPAVIRVGETLDLGPVPAIGQNGEAIRSEFSALQRSGG
jgi:crotonobetainyl-CoA:carnitine CoA-transferase CaiB-like acyl-CoA transferase